LFGTITNVNFDEQRVVGLIRRGAALRDKMREMYEKACAQQGKSAEDLSGPAAFQPADDWEDLRRQGEELNPASGSTRRGEVIQGLHDLILLGLKGSAAYVHHAHILGKEDTEMYGFMHWALDFLSRDQFTVDELLGMALETGKWNIRAMELLDEANTSAYGHPEPTAVRVTPVKGKAILVSGHDLRDLELLLQQTAGKGINVYTHGEMLPCHAYPKLKQYPHLVGNYGGAWQDQRKEFAAFPGAILMTTNCIQKPQESYQHRIFTTGLVAWPGVVHIDNDKDFTPVIEAALAETGFAEDEPEKKIMVGFARQTVLGVADQVLAAVKEGKIRHIFLVGGCDGARPGRNYYTELVESIPDDCLILTLACGKYRFNKLELGEVAGFPRLLDVGQCNDAYSAIKIAAALADALGVGLNDLPLSLVLSWYEQKAVGILLSLLYLGIKDMRLGPTLPAFVKPEVLEVLQREFNLMPTGSAAEDLADMLA
jgi:hydroxylamine reductase